MKGFFKRPDLTAETIVDDGLHTGDIGMWDGKFIKITDRKKELFKPSGGKYVAPQPIENKMKESPFIEQIMVVGANRKFTGALIVPSFNALTKWAKTKGINFNSINDLINHPEVHALYRNIIDEYNQLFNPVEQVKKFELLAHEWSIDTGEMTPKMSLKRKVVMEKYKDVIEKIYE
jgi:long-chain acyl-CoA synthetase